jgi:tetratricopeptide (TPR) repeat protein
MKQSKLFVIAFLMLSMIFVGYQCGSTEITSAKLYIQQKNWVKAIDVLQKDISKNPKSDEGYYLLGYVYGEQGNFEGLVEHYDKSLAISQSFSKNISDSRKYFWAQAFNRGVSLYQKGVKSTDKDSAEVYYDKSIADFKSALKIEPDSGDTYKNLAFVYLSKGDNIAAVEPLQQLIKREKALDGYKFLGEIYYVNGTNLNTAGKTEEAKVEFNKSIDVLEEGLKNYPDNPEMLITLSTAYIGANRGNEAIDKYKKLAEAKPDDENVRYNYGVLLLGAEDFANAEIQFKKAIEIKSQRENKDYDNAIYNLGVTYLKWGTYLNKKADEEGKVSDEYKSKYQAALPYLEKAVQMKDANAQTWELLGRVYSVLGMTEDAANAFKKADEMR